MKIGFEHSVVLILLLLATLAVQPVGSLAQNAGSATIKKEVELLGVQGCLTSNCHGNKVETAKLWNRAGDIWDQTDPHAFAYVNLRTKLSLEIVQKLWDAKEQPMVDSVDDARYHRFVENNCVSCHATELAPMSDREHGVDCQVCHGPARGWDDFHYSPGWEDTAKRFDTHDGKGRVDTKNPWLLASICGSCHIGDLKRSDAGILSDGTRVPVQPREVSHRLMAAGHPPTYFEFGHYLARYPKHWWDQDLQPLDAAYNSTRTVITQTIASRSLNTWRIGKIVHAKQRLELLGNRLDHTEWPEFTEHRCTSCHHPIDQPRKLNGQKKKPMAQWDGWYLEHVDLALSITQFENSGPPSAPFSHPKVIEWIATRDQLQDLLQDPMLVHQQRHQQEAKVLIDRLIAILDDVAARHLPMVASEQLAANKKAWLKLQVESIEDMSWESAVQLKLAAQAIAHEMAPESPYPKYPMQNWDLSTEKWNVSQAIPYRNSEMFDWSRFAEELQQILKTLD
jgi:hypothetical protein